MPHLFETIVNGFKILLLRVPIPVWSSFAFVKNLYGRGELHFREQIHNTFENGEMTPLGDRELKKQQVDDGY